METRFVFIDSSIIIGQNYNYRGAAFESLLRLSGSGQACVIVSDIVVREVQAHIAADVSRASQASTKFRKDARVLRNLGSTSYSDMFAEIDEDEAIAALNTQLDEFIAATNATVLDTSSVSVGIILGKYFGGEPPFGDGKKKSEFPDAINVEALEAWSAESNEKVYVVSSDSDLLTTCAGNENLLALDKLSEYVSLVQYHDDVLTPALQEKLSANEGLIAQAIEDAFMDLGFWLDDQEGDVDEVRVEEVDIEEFLVLEVDEESATVDVPIRIRYSADVTYDDMDTAFYDSEEKVLIPRHTIQTQLERNEEFESLIKVRYSVDDAEVFEIEEVVFTLSSPYGIEITVHDQWEYR